MVSKGIWWTNVCKFLIVCLFSAANSVWIQASRQDKRVEGQRPNIFFCAMSMKSSARCFSSLLKVRLRCLCQSRRNCRKILYSSNNGARQIFMLLLVHCISKESKSWQQAMHVRWWKALSKEISVAHVDPPGSRWRERELACLLKWWNACSTSPDFTKGIDLCLKTRFLPNQSGPVWSMSAGG